MSNDQNNGTRPNSPPVVRIRLEVDPPTRASIHVNGREFSSSTPPHRVDASRLSGAQPGSTPIDNGSGAQASHGPGNASAQAGAACSNDRPNAGRAGDAPGAPAAGGQSTRRTSHNPLPPPPRDPYRERLALVRMGDRDTAGPSGARFGSPDPARQRSARSSGAEAAANAQSGPSATQRQSGQSGGAQARASPANRRSASGSNGQTHVQRYCTACGQLQLHLTHCPLLVQDQSSSPQPAGRSSPRRSRAGDDAQAGSSDRLPSPDANDSQQQGRPPLRGILRRPTVEVDNDHDSSHLRPRNERPISPVAFAPHRFTGPLPPGARIVPIPERHRLSEDPVLPTPPISRQTSGGQRPIPPPFDRPPGYYARLYGLLPPDSPAQATPAQAAPAQAPAPQRWSQAGANGAQHAPWWYPFNQPVVQPTPERTTPGHHERFWVVPQTDYVPNAPGIPVSTSRRPRLEAILVRDPFNPYHVPSLRWDVRCPPMTAKHITSRATIVPVSRQEWNAPFTKDKSTQAQIDMSSYNRPELLGVFPRLHISQSTPITVLELLQYIYDWLQTPVWPREAEDLKTRYPHAWREAEEAFWTRCMTCPHITIPEVERRQGMKRVDLLVRQHIWSGMYVFQTETGRWFASMVLAHADIHDPRWQYQGGTRASH